MLKLVKMYKVVGVSNNTVYIKMPNYDSMDFEKN